MLFFPVGTAHVPVGKPFLFRFQVLHLHVEDTVVGDEGLEALVVVSGQPIDGEASEAGTYAAQAVLVNKRFLGHFVDGRKVVFHALASVVAADGFVPFHSEARQAAAVGSHDDVVVGCHNLEVSLAAMIWKFQR